MADDSAAAERARSAAFRLKHDLGKGIRFRAPREPEADDAALRERLARDLLATRETPLETLSAPQVFARWRREDEPDLRGATVPELHAIAAALAEIERLLPRLQALDRTGLLRLDALAREVSALCGRVFARFSGVLA